MMNNRNPASGQSIGARSEPLRNQANPGPIRVLIVDDHAVLRQALRYLLETQPGVEVVGDASNGREAVDMAEQLQPDVILMDTVMPGLNGIEATRRSEERRVGKGCTSRRSRKR